MPGSWSSELEASVCGFRAGFFRFTQLVPDTYVLEVVKPAVVAGGAYSFQFARQTVLASSQGSSVRHIDFSTQSSRLGSGSGYGLDSRSV